MDCREIRNRLSEYIDGMLDETEASEIKNHLAHCAGCSEAYGATIKIIEHMGQMESIEEPADFLDKVNARLDRRFSMGGIFRRLFRPWRIKLPLEMAAAAAVIALIVYLGGVKEPEPLYQITITESDERLITGYGSEKSEIMELEGAAPAEDATDASEKLAVGEPRPDPAAMDKALNDAGRSSQTEKRDINEKDAAVRESEPAKRVRDKKGDAVRKEAPAEHEPDKITGGADKPAPPETKRDKIDRFTRGDAPAESPLEETRIILRESTLVSVTTERFKTSRAAVEQSTIKEAPLQDAIRSLGGKVIETEYLEGTKIPTRMLIELPVGKFESLIAELTKRGELQAPPGEIKRKADELIRVELIFQRSSP
jgi:hypothetical protein